MSGGSGMLKDCGCLLFLITLMYSCTPSPEKTNSGEASVPDTSYYLPKNASPNIKAVVDTVEISEMKFQPQKLKVHKGDTVIWINQDLVTHCVTEENSKAWTSLPIPSGASWKIVAIESSHYYCAIHLVMKGWIVVE